MKTKQTQKNIPEKWRVSAWGFAKKNHFHIVMSIFLSEILYLKWNIFKETLFFLQDEIYFLLPFMVVALWLFMAVRSVETRAIIVTTTSMLFVILIFFFGTLDVQKNKFDLVYMANGKNCMVADQIVNDEVYLENGEPRIQFQRFNVGPYENAWSEILRFSDKVTTQKLFVGVFEMQVGNRIADQIDQINIIALSENTDIVRAYSSISEYYELLREVASSTLETLNCPKGE